MNFGALSVLAVAVALQALCAQSASLRSADGDIQQIDLGDKQDLALAVQTLVASLDDGDKVLVQHKLGVSTQSLDNLLRAIQDALTRVDAVLQNAYTAVLNAVTSALQTAQTATDNAINRWNQGLQDIINRNDVLNATLTQCRAQQPSLQTVGDALRQDVQTCAQIVQANATAAFSELETIRAEARALASDAQQAVDDCRPNGWLAVVCVINKLPSLAAEAVTLVGDATAVAARITGQLVINIPIRSAACVGDAVRVRGQEANTIISAVRQCVNASLNPSTAAPAA